MSDADLRQLGRGVPAEDVATVARVERAAERSGVPAPPVVAETRHALAQDLATVLRNALTARCTREVVIDPDIVACAPGLAPGLVDELLNEMWQRAQERRLPVAFNALGTPPRDTRFITIAATVTDLVAVNEHGRLRLYACVEPLETPMGQLLASLMDNENVATNTRMLVRYVVTPRPNRRAFASFDIEAFPAFNTLTVEQRDRDRYTDPYDIMRAVLENATVRGPGFGSALSRGLDGMFFR